MSYDDSQINSIYYPISNSVFITAPPGYGKTYVITERIKYLISSGNIKPPQKILALTFSNAAANEMKDRIRRNILNSEIYIDIMNYHSLAYFILKAYGNYIGISRKFLILDERMKSNFKKDFFQTYVEDLGKSKDSIYALINDYDTWYSKNYLQYKPYESRYNEVFKYLKDQMDKKFIDSTHLDFDHLLFKAIDLLSGFKAIKDSYYNMYKVVLADEFQDTNYIQYLLFKELTTNSNQEKKAVFVVGDKRQAIMKFQGANPENIDILIKDFNCKELELKENHRTSSDKIKILIDELRKPHPEIDSCHSYVMYINQDLEEEISKVVERLGILSQRNIRRHNICILFPQIKAAYPFKKRFDLESIPYVVVNDFKIDAIRENYSELFVDIEHYISINYDEKPINRIIKELIKKHYPGGVEKDLVLATIERFSALFDRGEYSYKNASERLIEFYNYLQMDIEWAQLLRSKTRDKLFISTIHGSKGLEFDHVLMIGIVNYRMPHNSFCIPCNSFDNMMDVDVSEAKDLFYVGISRAVKDLSFFFSEQDEQNLKSRKISCIFKDILPNIKFIDFMGRELTIHDSDVSMVLCNK